MKFEERLSEIMNGVEVPDELLPENIAAMLKEKNARTPAETRKITIAASAQKRTILFRTSAAVAACAVFAAGMLAMRGGEDGQEQLEEPIVYEAVSPESYDALYEIYTGITLNGGGNDAEKTIDEADGLDAAAENRSADDFTDNSGAKVSEADIVKTDGNYMYCLKGSTLYIVSLETMETVSQIESSLDPPVEIYIEGDRLILISREKEEIYIVNGGNETAVTEASENGVPAPASDVPANDAETYQPSDNNSDVPDTAYTNDKTASAYGENGESAIPAKDSETVSRTNTAVNIYNISDPADPVRTTAYKQNGSYVSSKFSDGTLYLVTSYSDYRVKPLDTQDDLDSFVPAYYLNGEKSYLAAEDIIIPSNASSTDYTVVSAINAGAAEAASVKAVLGSSRNVYCSADALYIVGVGRKDNREYSVISSFGLTGGGISYRASGSVEGAVLGQQSMNEYGGLFRIAAETTDENGKTSVSVYVLDRSLTVVNSAGQLFPEGKASAVRFEKQYARIIDEKSGGAVIVLDLSADPPTLVQSLIGTEAYLYSYSDDKLLGVGKAQNGGLTLKMYDSETGLALNEAIFGSTDDTDGETFSRALTDRRAVLIDEASGIIGVPAYGRSEFGTKNSYYVFTYSEADGFTEKGVIEYIDADDSMVFKRGMVNGSTLYIISSGRIISARLDDLKIIDVYEY